MQLVMALVHSGHFSLRIFYDLFSRVIQNRVLRRIFGSGKEEVVGAWRRLRNEEIHNSYASLNITKDTKSRTMK
jgi:hypothetical protein